MSADEAKQTDDKSVATTLPPTPRRGKKRIDWATIEAAFVEGDVTIEGPDGATERTYPTLADVATRFGVSLRSVAGRSSRYGWVRKREEFQERVALELHRKRIRRMLREADAVDTAALTIAKAGMNQVLRRFQALQVEAQAAGKPLALMSASENAVLSRAGERYHKMARLALTLPTQLVESADEAERRRREKELASGADPDGMAQFLERLSALQDGVLLEAVDKFFGGTPAGIGEVINIKPMRERRDLAAAGEEATTAPPML